MSASQPAHRPTMSEVARLAQVSRGTVSRYLNGHNYVSERARTQIERAIAQTGYVPVAAARSLVRRRTDAVAMIIRESPDIFFNDYHLSRVASGANEFFAAHDYQLMMLLVDSPRSQDRIVRLLAGGLVDGALIASVRTDDPLIPPLASLKLPIATAGPAPERFWLPGVDADNRVGAQAITQRLMETGRRRIAVIQGPPDMPVSRQRADGVRDALGTLLDDRLCVDAADWTFEAGRAATEELLGRSPGIDGLVAANDATALGAISALRAAGRRVPDDVGVVGFDDTPQAVQSQPQLSTVHQDSRQMGQLLGDLILRQIGGDAADLRTTVPTTIRWRDSA